MTYEDWLKQQTDRTILALWIEHCTGEDSDHNMTSNEILKASLIQWEAQERNLLNIPMSYQY